MPKISRRRKGRESRLGKKKIINTRKLHGGSVGEVKYMHDGYKNELENGWYKNIHESKLEVSINLAKARCHVENLVVKSTLDMAIAMYNELNDDKSEVSKALATAPVAATAPATAAASSSTTATAALAIASPAAPVAAITLTSESLSKRPAKTAESGGKPSIQKGIEPMPSISGAESLYKSNLYNAIVNYIHIVNKSANSAFKIQNAANLITAKEKELFVVARTLDHNIPQKGDMYKMTTYIKDIIASMNSIFDALNVAAHPTIPALLPSTNTAENVGVYANSLITSGKADRGKKTDVAATTKAATDATATAKAATDAAAKAKTTAVALDDPLIAEKCKGVYEISVWFGEPVNKKLFERLTLIHSLNSFEAAYIKLATNIFELTDDAAVPAVKPAVVAGPAAGGVKPPPADASVTSAPSAATAVPPSNAAVTSAPSAATAGALLSNAAGANPAAAVTSAPIAATAVPPPPPAVTTAPSAATDVPPPPSIAAPSAATAGAPPTKFPRTRPEGAPPPFPLSSAATPRPQQRRKSSL